MEDLKALRVWGENTEGFSQQTYEVSWIELLVDLSAVDIRRIVAAWSVNEAACASTSQASWGDLEVFKDLA